MIRVPRLLMGGCLVALALATTAHGQPAHTGHVIATPASLQWAPGPPALPAGAMMVVLSGDPAKEGPFVIRAKLPDGWKVPPHMHPTDEHVTVIKGSLLVGMGEKVDTAAMKPLPAGGYALMPAKGAHYVTTKGETIIQVHALGPFAVTYVNPADDPRTKGKTN